MKKKSKRIFLFFSLFSLLSAFFYAESFTNDNEPETNSFSQELTQGLQFFLGGFYPSTVSGDYLEAQCLYHFNWNNIGSSSGLSFCKSKLDATGTFFYSPELFNFTKNNTRFSFGFEEILHCTFLYDVSAKFDFLSGVTFSSVNQKDFSIDIKLFYLLKLSKIYSIEPLLIDNEGSFSLMFQKKFEQSFIKFGLASYDFFYYPKAVAPIWMFAYGHNITPDISGEIDLNFRYIDMFTLSSYMESAQIKIGVEIKF